MPDIRSKGDRKYPIPGNRHFRWEKVLEEEKALKGHTHSQGEMSNYPPSTLTSGMNSLKKVT